MSGEFLLLLPREADHVDLASQMHSILRPDGMSCDAPETRFEVDGVVVWLGRIDDGPYLAVETDDAEVAVRLASRISSATHWHIDLESA